MKLKNVKKPKRIPKKADKQFYLAYKDRTFKLSLVGPPDGLSLQHLPIICNLDGIKPSLNRTLESLDSLA